MACVGVFFNGSGHFCLPDHIRSKVRSSADDTAVNVAVSNLNHAKILQEDLDRLAK